jgi:hypothetical protein
MSKKSLIDSIEVKTPCSEDWSRMEGSEKIRFCGHCAKDVNNISELTRKEAMRLVRDSGGNLCIRYIKNPSSDKPVFADRLYRITKRAGLAAGVLGASLTLSTVTYAQGSVGTVTRETSAQTSAEISGEKQSDEETLAVAVSSVSGTIFDANGAVIPNVTVSLFALSAEKDETAVSTVTSNEEGFYRFENVAPGVYKLKIAAGGGFGAKEVSGITISLGKEFRQDVPLEMDSNLNSVIVGDIGFVEYANPLARAVSEENLEEVKNLIGRGENVNGKDENYGDITPLFIAVENGNVEMTELLLDYGAKINARSTSRETPLMRLDADASSALVRVLIKHGAKINLTDDEGNTALIHAARSADREVLQMLIDHGAQINVQNKQGQTALMNAAEADNLESVRALIMAGADVNLKNKEGDTAWDLTSSDEIEELLVSHGAVVKEN